MVGLLLTILALVVGFVLLLSNIFNRKERSKNLPNGSMGWPLFGETLAFLKPHRSTTIGRFLQQHCSRYGKVFKSHLFGSPAIVSCDRELNMFVLQNEDKLFQASYPKAMHGILGKYSLLIVSGDLHKKLRNVVVSFVSSFKSDPSFLQFVEKLAISTMESWKDCKEVYFYKEMKKFTLSLMVKSLLSIEPGEPLALSILQDFETYMRGFVSLPLDFPGSAYAKAVKARARLSSTVREIIKERERGNRRAEHRKGDFLDVILSKWRLSHEEIVSVALDILLGGYETTSTVISLVVYFLGHRPKAFEKLKEEHEAIRRSKEAARPLEWEDYQLMEYTNNVMGEAMRCGNVVKFLHRKALKDVKYKGYIIPAGWKVLPVLAGVNLDSSLHKNPSEFNPFRWSDRAINRKVMPFGGGTRLCPGAELAKVVIAFFLHHLVLSYRWKLKPDDFPVAHPYVEFQGDLLIEIEPIG